MSTGVAFLGRGNRPARYGSADGVETWCAPVYLARSEGFEALHVFATQTVWDERASQLRADIAGAGCTLYEHVIPWGRDDAETWAVFDALVECLRAAPGPVVLDVTHGFRHVPLLAMLAAHYVGASGEQPVTRITYAALHMAECSGYAPVLDLKPHLDLFTWITGAAVFRRTGRTDVLGDALVAMDARLRKATRGDQGHGEARALGKALSEVSGDIGALRAVTLREASAPKLLRTARDPEIVDAVAAAVPPLQYLLADLVDAAMPLATMGATELVAWYVGHGQPALALGLGVEQLLNLTLAATEVPSGQHLEREAREAAKQRLFAYRLPGDETLERLRGASPLMAALSDAYFKFGDDRNDVMHAQQRKNPLSAGKVRAKAEQLVATLTDLEARLAEGERAPSVAASAVDDRAVRLFNTTLHPQHDYVEAIAELGYTLVPDPEANGFNVALDWTYRDIRARAESMVERAIAAGAQAVLIGGLSSAAHATIEVARARGLGAVEFATERLQDENGRFVFELRGVRVLSPLPG